MPPTPFLKETTMDDGDAAGKASFISNNTVTDHHINSDNHYVGHTSSQINNINNNSPDIRSSSASALGRAYSASNDDGTGCPIIASLSVEVGLTKLTDDGGQRTNKHSDEVQRSNVIKISHVNGGSPSRQPQQQHSSLMALPTQKQAVSVAEKTNGSGLPRSSSALQIPFLSPQTQEQQHGQQIGKPRPTRESVLRRLSDALLRRSLTVIDLSQRGLCPTDAKLVKLALLQNSNLKILKLGYNNLTDFGVKTLAQAVAQHEALESLDIGFTNFGDEGCVALAEAFLENRKKDAATKGSDHHNYSTNTAPHSCSSLSCSSTSRLRTLYLAGNSIGERGALSLAKMIECCACGNLSSLHLTGNKIGAIGVTALTRAINKYEEWRKREKQQQALLFSNEKKKKKEKKKQEQSWHGHHIMPYHLSRLQQKHQKFQLDCKRINHKRDNSGSSHNDEDCEDQNDEEEEDCGLQEIFLGGTSMSREGCYAVSQMMERSSSLRVLSLADCNLCDDDLTTLSRCIARDRITTSNSNNHTTTCTVQQHDLQQQAFSPRRLDALHLSFNSITCIGIESLMNALWGSKTLRELRIDNNKVGDRGAQLVAVVVSNVTSLERLDLGFNSLTAAGIRALMKSVAESTTLTSLSISGNKLDTSSSKVVAYALAYNHSLRYFFMDQCSVNHACQRHITAGIVSNSGIALRTLTGFRIGAVAVTLGLPSALEQWTNEQVLKFILLMWEQMRHEHDDFSQDRELDPLNFLPQDQQHQQLNGERRKPLDPATVVAVAKRAFASLGGEEGDSCGAAAQALRSSELESHRPREPSLECPISTDAIMLEDLSNKTGNNIDGCVGSANLDYDDASSLLWNVPVSLSKPTARVESSSCYSNSIDSSDRSRSLLVSERRNESEGSNQNPPKNLTILREPKSTPQSREPSTSSSSSSLHQGQQNQQQQQQQQQQMDPDLRKRRNVDWLCLHIRHLNDLAQQAFCTTELWKLHQHFLTPMIQVNQDLTDHDIIDDSSSRCPTNSEGIAYPSLEMNSNETSTSMKTKILSSIARNGGSTPPTAPPQISTADEFTALTTLPVDEHLEHQQQDHQNSVPSHDEIMFNSVPTMSRKVSYRFLNDAIIPVSAASFHGNNHDCERQPGKGRGRGRGRKVSNLIEDGMSGYSMQPRSKRARRNRSRVSYFPRVKAKLDSYLDQNHRKALILLRQLYYVEQNLLLLQRQSPQTVIPGTRPLFIKNDQPSAIRFLNGSLSEDAETILVDMM